MVRREDRGRRGCTPGRQQRAPLPCRLSWVLRAEAARAFLMRRESLRRRDRRSSLRMKVRLTAVTLMLVVCVIDRMIASYGRADSKSATKGPRTYALATSHRPNLRRGSTREDGRPHSQGKSSGGAETVLVLIRSWE